jgi:hypothetical protein
MSPYNADSAFTFDTNMYRDTASKSISKDEWTKVTFDYMIDESNVKNNISCLTIQAAGSSKDIFIDNIRVEECATDVVFTHISGADVSAGKSKPKLVIATDDTLKEKAKGNYKIYVAENGKITFEKNEAQKGNIVVLVFDKNGKIVKANASKSVVSVISNNAEYTIKVMTFDGEMKDIVTINSSDLK